MNGLQVLVYPKLLFPGGKIQVSNSTNMMLECVGGYVTQERGTVEIKVQILGGIRTRASLPPMSFLFSLEMVVPKIPAPSFIVDPTSLSFYEWSNYSSIKINTPIRRKCH